MNQRRGILDKAEGQMSLTLETSEKMSNKV